MVSITRNGVDRKPRVANNIARWKKILSHRYQLGEFDLIADHLAIDYQWHGTLGADYRFHDPKEKKELQFLSEELCRGFPDIQLKHTMFGEGNMVGNYFVITGTHLGEYFGVEPTGHDVQYFGVSIARFNNDGLLVEERELCDEIELLKQIEVIDNKEEQNLFTILSGFSSKTPLIGSRFEPLLPSHVEDILYHHDASFFSDRDPVVVRNEFNWRRFLNIKYFEQDFSKLGEVMSPKHQWQAPAGLFKDMNDPEDRAWLTAALTTATALTYDYRFTSHVFGEGNMLLYNVACEYSNTADLFGVAATGRRVRHPNICVCQFDKDGRLFREWEIYDVLAIYKQLGVLPSNESNLSLLGVIKNLQDK